MKLFCSLLLVLFLSSSASAGCGLFGGLFGARAVVVAAPAKACVVAPAKACVVAPAVVVAPVAVVPAKACAVAVVQTRVAVVRRPFSLIGRLRLRGLLGCR